MIEVKDLTKAFDDKTVLNNINMVFETGKTNLIIGQSGSGKTVLMKNLVGLLEPTSGEVLYDGRNFVQMSKKEKVLMRREMGMIFQTFNLMGSKNVFDNVAFPLEVWNIPGAKRKERVMELLSLVGLADKYGERVQSLSGGQKQRVGIARALALSPKVLLCDEATSALDPKTTVAILDLLESIRQELALTIIVVTHQMEVVKRACNRVLLLDGGITQGIGDTETLFLAPTPNLKKLIEDDFILIPSGTNIRLWFPREISQDAVITGMARALNIDFAIVGGKLERYIDDVCGFLIINVSDDHLERTLNYLQEKKLFWEVMSGEDEHA